MDYSLIHNEPDKQYEFHVDGIVAKIEYIQSGNRLYLTHTEVPEQLGGKGIASALVESVFKDIQQKGQKVIAICPFVVKYVKRHPEWEFLVASD